MVRAIVVSVQLGLIVRVKRLSYKFVQIVRMIQQEFSGYRMGQCHLQRLYHSLHKWTQRLRILPIQQRRFQRIPSTGQVA